MIQGKVSSLAHEGDIVIENDLCPSIIESSQGGIRFSPSAESADCEYISAENGFVDVIVPNFSAKKVLASSGHLNTQKIKVTELVRAAESLNIEAKVGSFSRIDAENLDIKVDNLTVEKITAGTEVAIQANNSKVGEIRAKRVIIHGRIDCQKMIVEETVVVESGQVSIKSLDCASFHASPDVSGIVVVSTCKEVKAEGVRGFLHPSELEMFSGRMQTVDLETFDKPGEKIVAQAMASAMDEPEGQAVDPAEADADSEADLETAPTDSEDDEASDYPTVPEVPAYEESEPIDSGNDVFARAEREAEEYFPNEDEEPLSSVDLEEAFDATVADSLEEKPSDSGDNDTIQAPSWEVDPVDGTHDESIHDLSGPSGFDLVGGEKARLDLSEEDQIPPEVNTETTFELDGPLEEALEGEDTELEDSLPEIDNWEEPDGPIEVNTASFSNDNVLEKVDAFDVMETPIEEDAPAEDADLLEDSYFDTDDSLDSADILDQEADPLEDIPEDEEPDQQGIEGALGDSFEDELEDDTLDNVEILEEETPQDPEALLIADLNRILDQIRAYFPEDNYPKFINQISRYIEDARFNLFAKARNRDAVLAGFDKYEHPDISALARTFFERLDGFFDEQ